MTQCRKPCQAKNYWRKSVNRPTQSFVRPFACRPVHFVHTEVNKSRLVHYTVFRKNRIHFVRPKGHDVRHVGRYGLPYNFASFLIDMIGWIVMLLVLLLLRVSSLKSKAENFCALSISSTVRL